MDPFAPTAAYSPYAVPPVYGNAQPYFAPPPAPYAVYASPEMVQTKPKPKTSSALSTKVWIALTLAATVVLTGLVTGYLIYYETNDNVGALAAYIRTNSAYTVAGIVMMSIALVLTVLGCAIRSRGVLTLGAIVLFTVAGYFAPIWRNAELQVWGVVTSCIALLAAWTAFRTSECIQEEAQDQAGHHFEGKHKTGGLHRSVQQVKLLGFLLAVLYILGAIGLLVCSELQDNPQNLATHVWNATAAGVQLGTALLAIFGLIRSMRGVLLISAVLSLFVISLYGTWIATVAWAEKNAQNNCPNTTLAYCDETGWLLGELAFNWINLALSILLCAFCVYYNERLQSWDEAEAHGVDRNLSDPCKPIGFMIHSPVTVGRNISFATIAGILAVSTGLLTCGCLLNGVNGLFAVSPYAPQADPVIVGGMAIFALVVGLYATIKDSRSLSILATITYVWIASYSWNIMVQQIFVVLDGSFMGPTVGVTFLTGYELGITIAICIFTGLLTLLTLIASMNLWIFCEVLQDLQNFDLASKVVMYPSVPQYQPYFNVASYPVVA